MHKGGCCVLRIVYMRNRRHHSGMRARVRAAAVGAAVAVASPAGEAAATPRSPAIEENMS